MFGYLSRLGNYCSGQIRRLSEYLDRHADRAEICSYYIDIAEIKDRIKSGNETNQDRDKFYKSKMRIRSLELKSLNLSSKQSRRKANQANCAVKERIKIFKE